MCMCVYALPGQKSCASELNDDKQEHSNVFLNGCVCKISDCNQNNISFVPRDCEMKINDGPSGTTISLSQRS